MKRIIPKGFEKTNKKWNRILNLALKGELPQNRIDHYQKHLLAYRFCVVGELHGNKNRLEQDCANCATIGFDLGKALDMIEKKEYGKLRNRLYKYMRHVKDAHRDLVKGEI